MTISVLTSTARKDSSVHPLNFAKKNCSKTEWFRSICSWTNSNYTTFTRCVSPRILKLKGLKNSLQRVMLKYLLEKYQLGNAAVWSINQKTWFQLLWSLKKMKKTSWNQKEGPANFPKAAVQKRTMDSKCRKKKALIKCKSELVTGWKRWKANLIKKKLRMIFRLGCSSANRLTLDSVQERDQTKDMRMINFLMKRGRL